MEFFIILFICIFVALVYPKYIRPFVEFGTQKQKFNQDQQRRKKLKIS